MNLIPTKPTIPKQRLSEFFIVVFGPRGIGKTSFANQFPGSIILLAEGGTSGLLSNEINLVEKAKETGELPFGLAIQAKKQLLEGEHPYQTIVIDTEDQLYDDCQNFVCDKLDINHPSDIEYGGGWAALKKEYKGFHRDIIMSQMGLVAVSHAQFKEIENVHGKKRDKVIPSVGGSSGEWLIDEADIVIFYDRDENDNRIMHLEGGKDFDAKQRLPFPNSTIDAGDSPEESFKNFKSEFDKAIAAVNKKYGITEDTVKDYYTQKEKNNELPELKKQIIDICKEKGINAEKNKEMLKEQVSVDSVTKLNYEKAKEYLNYVENI